MKKKNNSELFNMQIRLWRMVEALQTPCDLVRILTKWIHWKEGNFENLVQDLFWMRFLIGWQTTAFCCWLPDESMSAPFHESLKTLEHRGNLRTWVMIILVIGCGCLLVNSYWWEWLDGASKEGSQLREKNIQIIYIERKGRRRGKTKRERERERLRHWNSGCISTQ